MIPTDIIPAVSRADISPARVKHEFNNLLDAGAEWVVAGTARKNQANFFRRGLRPKHKIELFDTRFYLTNVRQIPELRFYVAYVVQENLESRLTEIHPRIFYKDLSLVWRSASHFTFVGGDIWVGKGDVRFDEEDETVESIEATTDLPLELQSALESLLKQVKRPASGKDLLELILRKGPSDRVEPYDDFTAPREAAASDPNNLINHGISIATFVKPGNPASLKIVKGFEPDFKNGIIDRQTSRSRLYGGTLRRFRVLSSNRLVQYYFIAGAKHVWIIPPQAMTTEFSSYGVRTIDVVADDDLFIPGYEYHHEEETENGVELYSQIPAGYAGEVCPVDDAKADASPWLDRIPLIRKFRRDVLKRH